MEVVANVENGSVKWKMEVGKWKSETRSGMAPIGHGTSGITAKIMRLEILALYSIIIEIGVKDRSSSPFQYSSPPITDSHTLSRLRARRIYTCGSLVSPRMIIILLTSGSLFGL